MEKKDYSLFKVVGISFLIFVLLTWFIPTGSFSSGEFVKGDIEPLGLYGIFTAPVYSFAVFSQYFILMLCIGGFYGILNKTSVYQKIVSYFSSKNKTKFLIASIIINALITSLFGETMIIFVLLPFFITVLLKLGYDKISSLASTVGASFVGMCASICGNMAIYKSYFKLEPKSFVVFNIIMFVIFVFLLCMYVMAKTSKCDSKNSVRDALIPLYDKVKSNGKNSVPLIIVLVMTLLLLVLGLYNWYYSFNLSVFSDFHDKLTSFELFNVSIVNRIFGDLSSIGNFSNYDLSAILVISSVIIAWLYSIKFSDFIDSFKKGIKDVLLPSIYVILASVVFSHIVTNSANISLTISNFILNLFKDFNVFTGVLAGICGSFFYNDYLYMMNGLYGVVSLYNTSMMPMILSLFQSVFGIMMFVLPVSITLIFGLKYLNISYKEWFLYIWKFLIQIFLISIVGVIILSMLV